jgi:hypothetical protein
MRRTRTVILTGVIAMLVAACGGKSHTTIAPVPSTPSNAATTTTTTTTTSTATTTTSTTAQSGLCRASGLQLSFVGQQGATGHGELGFALHNVSGHACQTGGYPGVLFLDSAGGALPTVPTHTTRDLAGSAPLRQLTVAPGQTVSFRLFVTHFVANGSTVGCANAAALQVIPPNDTASVRVAISGGGGYQCRTVTVIPLQPGTTAYP